MSDQRSSTPGTLADFLTAHRARIDPGDVGLPLHGHQRVAGLRREEVAVLAGVSSDYYTRLEQGRERNPSRRCSTPSAAHCGWPRTPASS